MRKKIKINWKEKNNKMNQCVQIEQIKSTKPDRNLLWHKTHTQKSQQNYLKLIGSWIEIFQWKKMWDAHEKNHFYWWKMAQKKR